MSTKLHQLVNIVNFMIMLLIPVHQTGIVTLVAITSYLSHKQAITNVSKQDSLP